MIDVNDPAVRPMIRQQVRLGVCAERVWFIEGAPVLVGTDEEAIQWAAEEGFHPGVLYAEGLTPYFEPPAE